MRCCYSIAPWAKELRSAMVSDGTGLETTNSWELELSETFSNVHAARNYIDNLHEFSTATSLSKITFVQT